MLGGEAAAHSVLGDATGEHEVLQVVASTGFRSTARHFKASERVPGDERAGDGTIDVEISYLHLGFHFRDVRRAP